MRLAKLALSIAFAAASAGPVLVLSGCGGVGANVGETHVGKQELYRTGNFDYDEFFEDVHGLQDSAKAIVADEKAARVPLGQVLGIGETSIDRMLEVLRDKAEEFAQSKNRVHFAIEGVDDQGKPLAGQQVTVTPSAAKGKQVPKDAGEFAAGLEQMAQKEGQVWEKYAPLPVRSKRLVEKADALKGSLEKEFEKTPKEKRDEIGRELSAAKQVSADIGELSEKVVANSLKFIKQSGELLTAAANAEIKPQDKSAKGPKGKPAPAAAPKPKDAPAKPKEPAKPVAVEKADKPDKPEKPAHPAAPKPAAGEGSDFNP